MLDLKPSGKMYPALYQPCSTLQHSFKSAGRMLGKLC